MQSHKRWTSFPEPSGWQDLEKHNLQADGTTFPKMHGVTAGCSSCPAFREVPSTASQPPVPLPKTRAERRNLCADCLVLSWEVPAFQPFVTLRRIASVSFLLTSHTSCAGGAAPCRAALLLCDSSTRGRGRFTPAR